MTCGPSELYPVYFSCFKGICPRRLALRNLAIALLFFLSPGCSLGFACAQRKPHVPARPPAADRRALTLADGFKNPEPRFDSIETEKALV
jgi:hypothetical protein